MTLADLLTYVGKPPKFHRTIRESHMERRIRREQWLGFWVVMGLAVLAGILVSTLVTWWFGSLIVAGLNWAQSI